MHTETSTTATHNPLHIQTDAYSGPLDVLIELIEKRKFLINDLSLAAVTDDYMAYITSCEEHPLREMAEFIVLASTLLLLKSKSLLPVLELTEQEEESLDTLERRLQYYQIFRNAGKGLASIFGKQRLYERRFVPNTKTLFLTDRYTTVQSLNTAIRDVIQNLPRVEEKPKVQVKTVISLEEMMQQLHTRIEKQLKLTFRDVTGHSRERGTIIVGFLAILEMIKQGTILARQIERHSDIEIERDTKQVPSYGV